MKKKFIVGLLAIVMCLTLVGCGKAENGSTAYNSGYHNGIEKAKNAGKL